MIIHILGSKTPTIHSKSCNIHKSAMFFYNNSMNIHVYRVYGENCIIVLDR